MNRKNYRKQITIGVIISFSLIFLSALYFFISLHHNLNNERSIVRVAENRFNIINEIKSSVDEVNDIKLDYLNKKDASLFIPYKMELKKMDELLRSLSLKDDSIMFSQTALKTSAKISLHFTTLSRISITQRKLNPYPIIFTNERPRY